MTFGDLTFGELTMSRPTDIRRFDVQQISANLILSGAFNHFQKWGDTVKFTRREQQESGLNLTDEYLGDSSQDEITVINLADNKCTDQCDERITSR